MNINELITSAMDPLDEDSTEYETLLYVRDVLLPQADDFECKIQKIDDAIEKIDLQIALLDGECLLMEEEISKIKKEIKDNSYE